MMMMWDLLVVAAVWEEVAGCCCCCCSCWMRSSTAVLLPALPLLDYQLSPVARYCPAMGNHRATFDLAAVLWRAAANLLKKQWIVFNQEIWIQQFILKTSFQMSSWRRNSIQNNLNNFKRQLTRKIHFELSEKHHAGTDVLFSLMPLRQYVFIWWGYPILELYTSSALED